MPGSHRHILHRVANGAIRIAFRAGNKALPRRFLNGKGKK